MKEEDWFGKTPKQLSDVLKSKKNLAFLVVGLMLIIYLTHLTYEDITYELTKYQGVKIEVSEHNPVFVNSAKTFTVKNVGNEKIFVEFEIQGNVTLSAYKMSLLPLEEKEILAEGRGYVKVVARRWRNE